MSGIDWGDAPTWVAGAFAAAAAFYTRGMLKSQRQQIEEQRAFIAEQSTNLELERAELRAQADERRHGQARLVKMDTHWEPLHSGDSTLGAFWTVFVESRSSEPLRDVTVRFGGAYNPAAAFDNRDNRRAPVPLPLLGPHREYRFTSQQSAGMENNRPVLFFTDNAGVRWRLDEHGELSEVPPEATPGE